MKTQITTLNKILRTVTLLLSLFLVNHLPAQYAASNDTDKLNEKGMVSPPTAVAPMSPAMAEMLDNPTYWVDYLQARINPEDDYEESVSNNAIENMVTDRYYWVNELRKYEDQEDLMNADTLSHDSPAWPKALIDTIESPSI